MKVIGHRGAAGLAPENTFAGFDLALEMGIDGIESVLFLVYIAALHVKEDSPRRAGSPWAMTMSMGEALFQPAY